MKTGISRTRSASLWMFAVSVLAACSVFLGMALTVGNGELWLIACLAPPAAMLLVWRAAKPTNRAVIRL